MCSLDKKIKGSAAALTVKKGEAHKGLGGVPSCKLAL